ncbi:MAG: sodium:solute symporter family protein, partial [Pseudomonadota bacterium]
MIVTLLLFFDGLEYFGGDPLHALRAVGASYASAFNPDSSLYFDFFSVFVSGFIVTFALMLQPHILTKVLYLKNERDIGRFISTTVIVGTMFTLMLMIGFYARLAGLEVNSQDTVVREYLLHQYSDNGAGEYMLVFVFLTLLAAGMSTLDGILVALSAMVVNDIVQPLSGSGSGSAKNGLLMSRLVLIGVGVLGAAMAWDPPPLIGLFAQKGVYGLAAASLVPILFGVLFPRPISNVIVFGSALLGFGIHLALNLSFGIENPAISATYGIFGALLFASSGLILSRATNRAVHSSQQ